MSLTELFRSDLDGGVILRDYFAGDIAAYLKAADRAARSGQLNRSAARRQEFSRWRTMIRRCTDPAADSFEYYGARGISVCDRWLDFGSFFADMGPAPDGKTLDRINPDGNYEPANCRWATSLEQASNKRPARQAPQGSVSFVEGRWRALVRVKGRSKSRRFTDRNEALAWARVTAAEFLA